MKALTAMAAALAACSAAWTAGAGKPDKLAGTLFGQPPEVLAHRANLIVVGKVLSTSQARKLTVTLPGATAPVTRSYSRCSVRVSQVLKAPPAAEGEGVSKGSTVEFEALALPAGSGRRGGAVEYRPTVMTGLSYLLLLDHLPGTRPWVLPYGADHYAPPTAENVQRIAEAVRLDNWPWGPEAGHLRIAMICKWTEWGHNIRGKNTVFFRTYVALRNTSAQTQTVNLRPEDSPLWVEARHADGRVVKGDVYRPLLWRLKGEYPKPAELIAPGEAIFAGLTGKEAVQIEASMDLETGEWTIYAGYRNGRKQTEDGKELWTGEILSQPMKVQVLPAETGRGG